MLLHAENYGDLACILSSYMLSYYLERQGFLRMTLGFNTRLSEILSADGALFWLSHENAWFVISSFPTLWPSSLWGPMEFGNDSLIGENHFGWD